MVEEVEGGRGRRGGEAWRGRLVLAVVALTGIANACGGRTVWVEEEAEAGQSGVGGTNDGGTGAYGGTGGDYGGGGYGGGDYGGTGYGGYGGTGYGGYGGDYGGTGYGGYGGSVAGTSYGGIAGTSYGGVSGTSYGGTAGIPTGGVGGTGKGGCGATGGATGGAGGFPGFYKSCSVFCPRYPYATCPADFDGPRDCLAQCQNGFGLPPQCQLPLYNFLVCAGQVLNPNAQCTVGQDGQCYGPGCTVDAVNACVDQYLELLQCADNPVPPCPPPPDPPPPPNCTRRGFYGEDYCQLTTSCPSVYYATECFYQPDYGTYLCDCVHAGENIGEVQGVDAANPCQAALPLCGFQ